MSSRSIYCVAILLSFLASTSRADDRTQEAYQRLHEREAARAAAATQPANITNAQVEAMQKRIKDLERQVWQLVAENRELRAEAADKATAQKRAADAAKREQDEKTPLSAKVKKGMTFQQVVDAIGFKPRAMRTDADGEKVCVWQRTESSSDIPGPPPLPTGKQANVPGLAESMLAQQRAYENRLSHPRVLEVITVTFGGDKVIDFEDESQP